MDIRTLFTGPVTPETRGKRLLALADHIDTCGILSLEESNNVEWALGITKRFTMEAYNYKCKSPACLMGHGLHIAGVQASGEIQIDIFARIYGISIDEAGELVAPRTGKYSWDQEPYSRGSITPHHAANVLRHFVASGEIDWDRFGESGNEAIPKNEPLGA